MGFISIISWVWHILCWKVCCKVGFYCRRCLLMDRGVFTIGTLKVQKKFKRRVKEGVTRSPKVRCSCEKLGKRASFLLRLRESKNAETTRTSFRKFSPTRT